MTERNEQYSFVTENIRIGFDFNFAIYYKDLVKPQYAN